jgi:tyrosine-protein kinase Etk/Wzc
VVDKAILGEEPVKPRKALVVLISALMGGFLGILVAFIRSMMDKAVYDPNVVESNLNLPVYATIPLSQAQVKLNKQGWQVSNNGNLSQSLLFREDPDDQAIEAMRFLRTSFESGELHVSKHSIVAITGPSPNVGKTFLSANMACLLSELGHNVLLIDADLRRGQINEYFALENECGLADYLSDTVNVDAVIKYSGIRNLDVVTRGGSPDNPSVLMSSKQLKNLLDEARRRYDIVIIDTPPALAVTDATIISRYCDKLMLVIRAGLTTMDEVAVSWRRLTQSGKKPSGLVMSCYDPSKLGYKKYQQYGYY